MEAIDYEIEKQREQWVMNRKSSQSKIYFLRNNKNYIDILSFILQERATDHIKKNLLLDYNRTGAYQWHNNK